MVSGLGGRKGCQYHYLDLGSQQNALAIVLGWSYLGVGGWLRQKTLSSPCRFRGTQRLHVREARPLEDPNRRRWRRHRPLRPKKSFRAPNRPDLPNEGSKQNSLACLMPISPLGGACNPRLQRESLFKHNSHEKEKKGGGALKRYPGCSDYLQANLAISPRPHLHLWKLSGSQRTPQVCSNFICILRAQTCSPISGFALSFSRMALTCKHARTRAHTQCAHTYK